jgi:hypothetical protein
MEYDAPSFLTLLCRPLGVPGEKFAPQEPGSKVYVDDLLVEEPNPEDAYKAVLKVCSPSAPPPLIVQSLVLSSIRQFSSYFVMFFISRVA